MATSGIYDGTDLRLYVNSGTGSKTAIAYATSCEVSLSADSVDITHKDNAGGGVWAETTPKTLSGSISCEAYWAQTLIGSSTKLYSTLFGFFSNRTKIAFAVKTGTTGDFQLTGFCYVTDISGSAPDKEEATFSFTLSITGAVTQSNIT